MKAKNLYLKRERIKVGCRSVSRLESMIKYIENRAGYKHTTDYKKVAVRRCEGAVYGIL